MRTGTLHWLQQPADQLLGFLFTVPEIEKREWKKDMHWSKQHENMFLLYQTKHRESLMAWLFYTSLNPRLVPSPETVSIANAFAAVIPLFLTFISLIFRSDHATQRQWEHHKSKPSWKSTCASLERKQNRGAWPAPTVKEVTMPRWFAGWLLEWMPLNIGGDQKRDSNFYELVDDFCWDNHYYRFKKNHRYSSTVL